MSNYPFGKPMNTQPSATGGMQQSAPVWIREPKPSNALGIVAVILGVINLLLLLFVVYVCIELQSVFNGLSSLLHR